MTDAPGPRRPPEPLKWIGVYLAAGLPVALFEPDVGQSTWYPPLAVAIVLMLTCGIRWSAAVFALELAISVLQYHGDAGAGFVSAVVTTGEAVVAVLALRMLFFRITLARLLDVVNLIATAVVVSLGGATIGLLLLDLIGFPMEDRFDVWQVWVVGELTGIVLTVPVLLLVVNHHRTIGSRLHLVGWRQRLEFLVAIVLAIGSLSVYFLQFEPGRIDTQSAGTLMLCLLPLVWIAIRFGAARTSIAIVIADMTAALSFTGLGAHLGGGDGDVTSVDLVSLQLPMLAIGIAAICVSVAMDAAAAARAGVAAMVDASPVAIIVIDLDGNVRNWSRAAEEMFGYPAEEVVGRYLAIVPDDGHAAFDRRLVEEQTGPVDARVEYQCKDGTRKICRLHTSPMRDQRGKVDSVLGMIEDITERVRLEQRQALLNTAIDQAGEALVVSDPTPAIIYANPAAVRSSGYSIDEVMGQNPRIFKSGLHNQQFYEELWATITSGQPWHGVLVNRRKNGELYEEDSTIAPVTDDDGHIIAYVSIKRDLTEQRRLEADLKREVTDRETVLAVIDKVRSGGSVRQNASSLCDAILDVAGFDRAVIMMVQADGALQTVGRSPAVPGPAAEATLGPDTGAPEVLALSDRSPWWVDWERDTAITRLWGEMFRRDGITASGFAAIRWEGRLVGVLMVATTDPTGPEWMGTRLGMVAELGSFAGMLVGSESDRARQLDLLRIEVGRIIDEQLFHPVFQPYVELATRQVRGYEALTRFHDGVRPDRRVADAWSVGLGPDLECALARAALEAAIDLPEDQSLSLNFSPETVLKGLAKELLAGTERQVVIEITEHARVDDYAAMRAALALCGPVKVSVDDAGAGFASLRHILELEPDVVKLDIGLIRGIDDDLARQALAAGLCHYAEDTGTTLIAEGVETEEEAETVRRLGVHLGQGYLFGRPAAFTSE